MGCLPQLVRGLGHRAAWHYPLGWLSGDFGDEVVVAVVMQERDSFSFGDGGNQQVGNPTARMRPVRQSAPWTASARCQSSS